MTVPADCECPWYPIVKGTWNESDHDRADDGKFGSGSGSSDSSSSSNSSSSESGDKKPDEAANRPSKKNERKEGVKPPSLEGDKKVKPPKPRGESKAPRNAEGRPVTGYSASGLTNTAFGDMVEQVSSQLGLRNILPEGRRSNKNVAEEGSSIDTEYDHSGYAFEIKACAVEAQEYKAAPKKEELADKKRFAEKHGLKPGVMVIVTDVEQGKAWAYWKEGIDKGGKLNPDKLDDWNYAGEVSFTPPAKPEKKTPKKEMGAKP